MEKTHDSYDEWYDAFQDFCIGMGYSGSFMKETWESDYEEGKDPYDSAEEFVKEMNE